MLNIMLIKREKCLEINRKYNQTTQYQTSDLIPYLFFFYISISYSLDYLLVFLLRRKRRSYNDDRLYLFWQL